MQLTLHFSFKNLINLNYILITKSKKKVKHRIVETCTPILILKYIGPTHYIFNFVINILTIQ